MKKTICAILTLCWVVQFSTAQNTPLEIYSAYRFYLSDKTPTGSGFKLRHFTNVKHKYLFSVYNDHIVYSNKENIVYKIYKVKRYSDATHYLVNDPSRQYFDITIDDDIFDKKHLYGVTLTKTDKNGSRLSVTRFDVKKIK